MANSPLIETKTLNHGSNVPFSKTNAHDLDLDTLLDVSASSTYIKALERQRVIEELDAKRPRFKKEAVGEEVEKSPFIGVINSAISNGTFPKRTFQAEQVSLATIYKGRVSLKDACQTFGWDATTRLTFSFSSNDGITITKAGESEKKSGKLDSQKRCILPAPTRHLFELCDGDNLLIFTTSAPIEHVRLIPISLVLDALSEKESK